MRSIYQVFSGEGVRPRLEHGPRTLKQTLIWLAVMVLGLLIFAAAFTPLVNQPQCPSYTTRMPDGSECIIGVNFDVGLFWLAGIVVAFVGAVGALVSYVAFLSGSTRIEVGSSWLPCLGAPIVAA